MSGTSPRANDLSDLGINFNRVPRPRLSRKKFTLPSSANLTRKETLNISPLPLLPSFPTENKKLLSGETVGASAKITASNLTKKTFHGSLENLSGRSKSCHRFSEPKTKKQNGGGRSNGMSGTTKKTKDSLKTNNDGCAARKLESESDLINDNETLQKTLAEDRKRVVAQKVSTIFVYGALRSGAKRISELERQIMTRKEECAARLILHHLLLNSWRNIQNEVTHLRQENSELTKSIQNLGLQLRVVRHMQNREKEISLEKVQETTALKDEISALKEQNSKSRAEMERIESELNQVQGCVENLSDEKSEIKKELELRTEKNGILVRSLKLEKNRAQRLEGDNFELKRQIKDLEKQMRELTSQSSTWQERSRGLESECWGIKLETQNKEKDIQNLKSLCSELEKQKCDCNASNRHLEENLKKIGATLEESFAEKYELNRSLEKIESKLTTQNIRAIELEKIVEKTKDENVKIRKELGVYKMQNVRRRREWGNALYLFFSPIDAMKLIYGGGKDKRNRLGQLNSADSLE